jgi:putative MATE family efflux protein
MQVQATYKNIWSLAFPIIMGALAQTVLGVTDTAFLGRVGETELAASAIGGVFYFTLIMIGMAVSIGAQIIIARKAGENDLNGISHVFKQSFLVLGAVGLLMFFIAHFLAPVLFPYIIHDTKVTEAATSYVICRSYGLLLWIPLLSIRAFLVGISNTKLISIQAIIMCAINVVLGYIFIFGHCGFPPMGIRGAAYASAISEVLASLYTLSIVRFHKNYKSYRLFDNLQANKATIYSIFRLSAPIVLQNFLTMGAWFVFFVMIEKLSTHALAISNVIRATYMIMMTPAWGFSSAANSMTSNLIGQGKADEIFLLLRKIITMSTTIITTFIFVMALFPHYILNVITNDQQLIEDCIPTYYIICVATVVLSIGLNFLSAVSGTGATRTAMYIEMTNIFCYLVFVYATCFIFKTRVEIVWLSEIMYWTMMGILSLLYLKTNKWRNIKI